MRLWSLVPKLCACATANRTAVHISTCRLNTKAVRYITASDVHVEGSDCDAVDAVRMGRKLCLSQRMCLTAACRA